MISIVAYDQKEKTKLEATQQELPALLANENVMLWLDCSSPKPEEIQFIKENFPSFHPLALEDAQATRHHPKLDEYHDYLFLIIHGVHDDATPERYKPVQLSSFLSKRYLVTFHSPMDEVTELLASCREGASPLVHGPIRLLHQLFDKVVDEFMPLMVKIEQRVQFLEDQVFLPQTANLLEEVFSLKRTLAHVRQTAFHQREVLHRFLQHNFKLTSEDDRIFFRDVYDHVIRVIDQVDSLREVVSSVVEANVSLSSHRLNEVMKVLTILSTIFLPLTFIVGVYGMNFDPDASPLNMPELKWYYGYPVILLIMALVAGGMIVYFKRKKWF
jgi:magnesium transporter